MIPFGGVALGALDALRHGLHWHGCELVPRFRDAGAGCECTGFAAADWVEYRHGAPLAQMSYSLGRHICPACQYAAEQAAKRPITEQVVPVHPPHHYTGNIELWQRRYGPAFARWGTAELRQGDSRHLLAVLGREPNASALVSSPPYGGAAGEGRTTERDERRLLAAGDEALLKRLATEFRGGRGYSQDAGQLGDMPTGELNLALSSPPYGKGTVHGGAGVRKEHFADPSRVGHSSNATGMTDYGDGKDPENLGNLPDAGLNLALSSPPYGAARIGTASGQAQTGHNGQYSDDPGQLGDMADAGFSAAVASPPHGETLTYQQPGAGGEGDALMREGLSVQEIAALRKAGDPRVLEARRNGGYSRDPDNLGNLPAGEFDAATSSPPYNLEFSRTHNGKRGGTRGTTPSTPGAFTHYGAVAGQIEGEAPETFWAASRQIVDQVYAGLRPDGHAIWVTKSYVRAGERVNFPEQWRQLCEAAGFVTLHEHRAWQIEDTPLVDLDGAAQVKRVEHKGFFRRQNEKNGAPRVDYEVIWCMVKPAREDV